MKQGSNVQTMTSIEWDEADLSGALRLDAAGTDRFVNPRLALNMNSKLFGGQFIANCLSAAMLTAGRRVPRMIQGVFLRSGHAEIALELEVERVHDGGRLSHRRVQMIQAGRLIFSAQVYLHDAAAHDDLLHQSTSANLAVTPETLDDVESLGARHSDRLGPELRRRLQSKRSVLVKPVYPEHGLFARSPEPKLAAWLKPAMPVSAEPLMQYAALAFLSDFWLCWPSRSSHIDGLIDPSNRMSSVDHSLWFHRTPCVDDWLLYEVESPAASENFGLGRGALYARDGRLVASSAQQAFLG